MTMLSETAGLDSGLAAAFGADSLTSATSIVKGLAKANATTKAISAFMVEPLGMGEALCPSVR